MTQQRRSGMIDVVSARHALQHGLFRQPAVALERGDAQQPDEGRGVLVDLLADPRQRGTRRHPDAAADRAPGRLDVEVETGAAMGGGGASHATSRVAVVEPARGVGLVRRLVAGEPYVAMDAEERALRVADDLRRDAREPHVHLFHERGERRAHLRLVRRAVLLEPLAIVVAAQRAEEGQRGGSKAGELTRCRGGARRHGTGLVRVCSAGTRMAGGVMRNWNRCSTACRTLRPCTMAGEKRMPGIAVRTDSTKSGCVAARISIVVVSARPVVSMTKVVCTEPSTPFVASSGG